MLAITTTSATTSAVQAAETFMSKLDNYNGAIYLAVVGRFMLLMKHGAEAAFESASIVLPVIDPVSAARMGFAPGAEAVLWAAYRKNFKRDEALLGAFDEEDVVKRGGVRVDPDDEVFMYPRPAIRKIGDTTITVHGDHSCLTADMKRAVDVTEYDCYKSSPADHYNLNATRKLNDKELQPDAKYQADHRRPVFGSISDRMHDMREWWEEQRMIGDVENAEDDMLQRLEQSAIRLYREAKNAERRIEAARKRMATANAHVKRALSEGVFTLEDGVKRARNEARTLRRLAEHLEELINDRRNGAFEEQNFEFGGQLREIMNTWADAFESRDTSWTERLHAHTDILCKMLG